MDSPHKVLTNSLLVFILASVITSVWAISFIVDIIVKEYDPPTSVHLLMMVVAGSVFGEGFVKSRNNNISSQIKEGVQE